MIKLKSLNQNLFYYFNLNLINSNLKFKDNLFYIDLILNLYISIYMAIRDVIIAPMPFISGTNK